MSPQSGAGQTVLAFDFGEERIGVAVGVRLAQSARALAVVRARGDAQRFEAIAELIAQWSPDRLVVGVPRHPDGTPHRMTQRCERFARQLKGRFGLAVDPVDERYSSVQAASELDGEGDVRRRRRPASPAQSIDAQAAAVILRQYWSETDFCAVPAAAGS